HMVVSSGGPICSCGKPGHLEAYASAPAIVNRFRERLNGSGIDAHGRWASGAITVRAIFAAAAEGDETAQEVVEETVRMLGMAVANLITVVNPACVVVGGAVAEAGEHLMNPLSARVRQYAYPASMRRARLALSQLGADATVLGAVALALGNE
ncbi:MAG TPA: ROK family protein, partial [Thermomicrobiaceae bacterium]|nr:ROK family protein [Thermomicrobiaceae bacterium]